MSIPIERHLSALLGSSIFNLTLRRGGDPSRSTFIRDLAEDERVEKAVQRMLDTCEGLAPIQENKFPKEPVIGDVKYCVDRFISQPANVKAAIQHFVSALLESPAMQTLKNSRVRLDAYLRRRFHLSLQKAGRKETREKKTRFVEPKPMQGGQSYIGQPTPSDTKIRHQSESRGIVEATQNNSLGEPDSYLKEPERQGTKPGDSTWWGTVRRKIVEAAMKGKLSVEKSEEIYDQNGYLNEATNTYYETFEEYLRALPSWEEFVSRKKWDYDEINHLLKQAGFHGKLSEDMLDVPLPKDASAQEVIRWVQAIWTKGMNAAMLTRDVLSAYTFPYYHAGRFIAAQTAKQAGMSDGAVQALFDPLSTIQDKSTDILRNGFNSVYQMRDQSQGESTEAGRAAISSTATAMTGVGAGFRPTTSSTTSTTGTPSTTSPPPSTSGTPSPSAPPVNPILDEAAARRASERRDRASGQTQMTPIPPPPTASPSPSPSPSESEKKRAFEKYIDTLAAVVLNHNRGEHYFNGDRDRINQWKNNVSLTKIHTRGTRETLQLDPGPG